MSSEEDELRARLLGELEADKAAIEHLLERAKTEEVDESVFARARFRLEDVQRRIAILKDLKSP